VTAIVLAQALAIYDIIYNGIIMPTSLSKELVMGLF
jgi:hypothetical protein